jgi:hypothetical protein
MNVLPVESLAGLANPNGLARVEWHCWQDRAGRSYPDPGPLIGSRIRRFLWPESLISVNSDDA